MATAADLRRLALGLEGTQEVPHVDRCAFRVARIYATLAPDQATANLKLAPEEQEFRCLLAPEAFARVPGGWGRMGYTTVLLSAVSEPELSDVLAAAWRHALPRNRQKSA